MKGGNEHGGSSGMPEESYRHLIGQLDDLIQILERHSDARTREQVFALLTGLDALHREGLSRLVAALREAGGASLLEQASRDAVVETFLGLYDLAQLNLPEEPPPRPDPSFVPLTEIRVPAEPRAEWVPVARTDDLSHPGASLAAEVDAIPLLLVNVKGEILAYRNGCPRCGRALDARLRPDEDIVCPGEGARYDARTGRARGQAEERLLVLPVAVRGETILLARSKNG